MADCFQARQVPTLDWTGDWGAKGRFPVLSPHPTLNLHREEKEGLRFKLGLRLRLGGESQESEMDPGQKKRKIVLDKKIGIANVDARPKKRGRNGAKKPGEKHGKKGEKVQENARQGSCVC
jgi:hypothetical protein